MVDKIGASPFFERWLGLVGDLLTQQSARFLTDPAGGTDQSGSASNAGNVPTSVRLPAAERIDQRDVPAISNDLQNEPERALTLSTGLPVPVASASESSVTDLRTALEGNGWTLVIRMANQSNAVVGRISLDVLPLAVPGENGVQDRKASSPNGQMLNEGKEGRDDRARSIALGHSAKEGSALSVTNAPIRNTERLKLSLDFVGNPYVAEPLDPERQTTISSQVGEADRPADQQKSALPTPTEPIAAGTKPPIAGAPGMEPITELLQTLKIAQSLAMITPAKSFDGATVKLTSVKETIEGGEAAEQKESRVSLPDLLPVSSLESQLVEIDFRFSDLALQIGLLANAEIRKSWPVQSYIPYFERAAPPKSPIGIEQAALDIEEFLKESAPLMEALAKVMKKLSQKSLSRKARKIIGFVLAGYAAVLDGIATEIVETFADDHDMADKNRYLKQEHV
jgi:hypothetical protein